MKRLITIFIFFFLPYSTLSQGIWKTYTRADGLAGESVYCIAQDKIGNLWFGTWDSGISILDTNGVITNIMNTDSSVYIVDIEIDSSNNKWIALSQDGGQFNGTYVVKFNDSTFTYHTPTGNPYYEPQPCCLGQDSLGHIWCGTTRYGLACWFDGIDWHEFYVWGTGIYTLIHEIVMDRHGKLYFAHERGVSTLNDYIFWGWDTYDIAFDKQNRMWLGTTSWMWGLAMFDGENWHAHTENEGLLKNRLRNVAVDSSNNVWVNYLGSLGVSKFDGHTFTHFNQQDGLAHNQVWDIFVDRKGDIWFATQGGVTVLHDTTTTKVKKQPINKNEAKTYTLYQNYPNPFNSSTTISYYLNIDINVELLIYNLTGKEVITLVDERQTLGLHEIQWNGKNAYGKEVSSGIYILVLISGNFKESIKLSLIR